MTRLEERIVVYATGYALKHDYAEKEVIEFLMKKAKHFSNETIEELVQGISLVENRTQKYAWSKIQGYLETELSKRKQENLF